MKIPYLESIEFGAKKNIKQINTEAKTKGVS